MCTVPLFVLFFLHCSTYNPSNGNGHPAASPPSSCYARQQSNRATSMDCFLFCFFFFDFLIFYFFSKVVIYEFVHGDRPPRKHTVLQLNPALGSRARACNSNFSTLATGMVLQGVFEMSYFVHHTQSSASCMYGMVTSKDAKLQHPARDGCQSFITKAKQPSPGAAAWSKCKTRVPQAGTETGRPRL